MFKKIIILSLALVLFSPKLASSSLTKKHFIYLVHGIAGDKDTFAYMDRALVLALKKKSPSIKYIINSFEYETGNDSLNTFNFSDKLCRFIAERSKNIGPHDKISFVAHSQGGIVSSLLIYRAFSGRSLKCAHLAPHFNSLTTLGSPFWGAKISGFGHHFKKSLRKLGIKSNVKFGENELKEMSFGSKTVRAFRRLISHPESSRYLNDIFNQVRVLSVAGFGRSFNPVKAFALGRFEYEDDTAVPIPSANPNYYSLKSIKRPYSENDLTLATSFELRTVATFHLVDATHIPYVSDNNLIVIENLAKLYKGVASIPEICLQHQKCWHPSFDLVLKNILGEKIEKETSLTKRLTGFIIDLKIDLPNGHKEKVKINSITPKKRFFWQRSKIILSHAFEIMSKGGKRSSSGVNKYLTGSVIKTYDKKIKEHHPAKLTLIIESKGLKTRHIEALVRPGHTTYIHINLE